MKLKNNNPKRVYDKKTGNFNWIYVGHMTHGFFHIKHEGEEIAHGITVYPLCHPRSIGFSILLFNYLIYFRYDKASKKIHFFVHKIKGENNDTK